MDELEPRYKSVEREFYAKRDEIESKRAARMPADEQDTLEFGELLRKLCEAVAHG